MIKDLLHRITSFLFYYLGIWNLLIYMVCRIQKKPIIAVFTFHRIVKKQNNPNYLIEYEWGINKSDFQKQIKVLSKKFKFLDLKSLIEIVNGRKTVNLCNRCLGLVTFDDGDSEFIENAFPILNKLSIPSLMFLPTRFIDTGRSFFHLRLSNLCNNLTNENWNQILNSDIPNAISLVLKKYWNRYQENKIFFRKELGKVTFIMDRTEVLELLDKWEKKYNVEYNLGIKCMTWRDVEYLHSKNVSIGSHTENHAMLEHLNSDEIKSELIKSKITLEKKLNTHIDSISFPVGSYSEVVLDICKQCNYEIAFTTKPGMVDYPLKVNNNYEVPRISPGVGPSHVIFYPIGMALLGLFINIIKRKNESIEWDSIEEHDHLRY